VAGQGALDYDGQLNPITKRLAAVTLALSYSINLKLATAGDEALQMYQWAKRHVAKPDGGGARVFVDEMQRVGRTDPEPPPQAKETRQRSSRHHPGRDSAHRPSRRGRYRSLGG
jgi:hypothetical protein